jgi:hypothetical protein
LGNTTHTGRGAMTPRNALSRGHELLLATATTASSARFAHTHTTYSWACLMCVPCKTWPTSQAEASMAWFPGLILLFDFFVPSEPGQFRIVFDLGQKWVG